MGNRVMENFSEERHDQNHSVESSDGREEESLEGKLWKQGDCL